MTTKHDAFQFAVYSEDGNEHILEVVFLDNAGEEIKRTDLCTVTPDILDTIIEDLESFRDGLIKNYSNRIIH